MVKVSRKNIFPRNIESQKSEHFWLKKKKKALLSKLKKEAEKETKSTPVSGVARECDSLT